MRLIWAALPVLLGLGALGLTPPRAARQTFLLTGDSRGSLGPCGCTKPMTGGLKRLATAIRAYRSSTSSALLINGDFTGGNNRQEVLKADAFGEELSNLSPTAVRIDREDLRRNSNAASSIRVFLGEHLLEGTQSFDAGAFRVVDDSAHGSLIRDAISQGLRPVVMIEGDLGDARKLATEFPEVALVQYRSDSRGEWSRQGSTLLVTPGSKLRDLAVVNVEDGELGTPKIVSLDEHIADDPEASRIYRAYLVRVEKENLLGQVDRSGSEKYSGSRRCLSCHAAAGKIWVHTGHSHALGSLERVGHGKDPECVPCHVVGLDRTYGFRDRLKTASLANVGCESCHGAGAKHASRPRKNLLRRVDSKRCLSCHTTDQSPGFNFAEFWKQIKH